MSQLHWCDSDIVALRNTGEERPLFLVHDITGCERYFSDIAECIDPRIPVYGLLGVPIFTDQLKTVESMAARHVESIRRAQPSGPYRLAGWGFGALLAHEIATQLLGVEEHVEFLGMIDLGDERLVRAHEIPFQNDVLERFESARLACLATIDSAREAMGRVADDDRFIEQFVRCADENVGRLTSADAQDILRKMCERLVVHLRAGASYTSHRIPIRAHFLSHSDGMPRHPSSLYSEVVAADVLMERQFMSIGSVLSSALFDAITPSEPLLLFDRQPMVTIQDTGSRDHSIFFVPGAGDSVSQILPIASELGERCRIYGWQYQGLDDSLPPHTSVEVIANACLRAIADRGLNSLHLVGHSFGGWVGFELAYQLSKAGMNVASLTLIDSEPPDQVGQPRREVTANEALQQWIELLELAAGTPLLLDDSIFASKSEAERIRLVHKSMVCVGLVSARSRPESLQGSFTTFCAALRTNYQPKHGSVTRVHLITADDLRLDTAANRDRQCSMLEGWKQWASDLIHWHGPGNHMTILKPEHATSVAAFWMAATVQNTHARREGGKGVSLV